MGPLLLAVHISDGVLTTPWLAAGFAGMALLMLPACYRVRDEEIPRIALLTAAFFVASLIHIRVGPTSVHLLLNGLIGVVLGRRAGLAIPIGLLLQAVLLGHGGISSLGVNACVMTIPALLSAGLFPLLRPMAATRHPLFGGVLVFASAFAWLFCLVFAVRLLMTNPLTGTATLNPEPALRLTLNPAVLLTIAVLSLGIGWWERREGGSPAFAPGLALGVFSVLATVALNAAVLLWGGAEDWHSLALLVFVAHLPIAALEGIVLGFTVSFLARVKPEMLNGSSPEDVSVDPAPQAEPAASASAAASAPRPSGGLPTTVVGLVATLVGLAAPGTARAHRLEAEYRILPNGTVQVESWFDLTGDSPQGATVQVLRPSGEVLQEGKLDEKGLFSFNLPRTEALRVVVSAGAGHRKELLIPKADTATEADAKEPAVAADATFADRSTRVSAKDVLAGVGFLLALAAFVLSLRNARALRELRRDP